MKEILTRAGVPTAAYAEFAAGQEAGALAYLEAMEGGYVIKTDGLAAGKGVVVTDDLATAQAAVREYLSGDAFGEAGQTLVIEEYMTGPEVSLLVLCDGNGGAVPLAPAQDHKRIGDGDTGPNTGGMGAYSPVPFVSAELIDEVMAKHIRPTLDALAAEGIAYRGILYAGLMLTPQGPKMLEYNVRFGDPECEVVVPRLASDLYVHCREAAQGRLETEVRFTDDAAVTVVLAAEGYPATPRVGDAIAGLDSANAIEGVAAFHAGTKQEDDTIVTAGGRVLTVTALAPTVNAACARAYEAIAAITWRGMQFRRDIAHQAREEKS
jgi:phosphoribosylamine--glycine ligase